MAGDRIQINALERAVSKDINDLQDLQTRVRNDVLGQLAARRAVATTGGAVDTQGISASMGLDLRVGGSPSSLVINGGMLLQLSATHPAPPGPNESVGRLGLLRAAVTLAVPATPGAFMVIEAQVVDVTVVSENRDIFDVPSQTFIPAVVTKQVERQIQFQILQSTTAIPAFTGDPWVPMYGFTTDGSGEVPALPSTFFWDMRPDLKDTMGDYQTRGTPNVESGDAEVFNWACHSTGSGLPAAIGGNFSGRNGVNRAWLKADDGVIPGNDNLVTGAANTREHFYLCPLTANGVTVWPVAQAAGLTTSAKGILVRSTVEGAVVGPDNSGIITYDPGGAFRNFDPIPVHGAVYVASAFVSQAGLGGNGYVPFTQNSGGRCLIRAVRTGSPPTPVALGFESGAFAADKDVDLDMLGVIPNGARTAIVRTLILGSGVGVYFFSWRRFGTVDDFGLPGTASDVSTDDYFFDSELPVHESSLDGALAGTHWILHLDHFSGSPAPSITIDLLGWTF